LGESNEVKCDCMDREIIVNAPSKINYGLNVVGLTRDGFHSLDTVMIAIPVFDRIHIRLREDKIITTAFGDESGQAIDVDCKNNTAYKAAQYVVDKYDVSGVDIRVAKGVPIAGGMGGSSCDAAGVLYGYKRLLGLNIGCGDAARLGSDTAFLYGALEDKDRNRRLSGGEVWFAARCRGRGENMEYFESRPLNMVICVQGRVDTTRCFGEFGRMYPNRVSEPNDIGTLIRELESGEIGTPVGNALQEPAMVIEAEVRKSLELVQGTSPVVSFVTGSGAAVVGIYRDTNSRNGAYKKLVGTRDKVISVG